MLKITNNINIKCPVCGYTNEDSGKILPDKLEWCSEVYCFNCGIILHVSKTLSVNYKTEIRIDGLKQCPKCNSDDVCLSESETVCVSCNHCGYDGRYFDERRTNADIKAIFAWNNGDLANDNEIFDIDLNDGLLTKIINYIESEQDFKVIEWFLNEFGITNKSSSVKEFLYSIYEAYYTEFFYFMFDYLIDTNQDIKFMDYIKC